MAQTSGGSGEKFKYKQDSNVTGDNAILSQIKLTKGEMSDVIKYQS